MARERHRGAVTLLLFMAVSALGSCGDDEVTGPADPDNVAPTIVPVAEQTALLNTLTPRTLEVQLHIQDPDDDTFDVTLSSSDETIIAGTVLVCGPGACPLRLTPVADAAAEVTLTVSVSDGEGGEAETSFLVRIRPRLVTTTEDRGTGSLRQVIAVAEAGDVIGFDTDGTFATPQTILLLSELVLDKDLRIDGPGAAELTVSGSNVVRVFKVIDGPDVRLRDLTIADGFAPIETVEAQGGAVELRVGGGVFVGPGSTLTLAHVTVRDNRAPDEGTGLLGLGGGVANLEGTLVLVDCSITDNSAGSGGGVVALAVGAGAATTIDGCSILRNMAGASPGSASVGGGVANFQGTVLIRGSTIAENGAPSARPNSGGGGLSHQGGSLVIEPNSVVTANRASTDGGGLRVTGGVVSVTDTSCVILDNVADADGDGVGTGGGIYAASDVDLSGVPATAVCSNSPDDIAS